MLICAKSRYVINMFSFNLVPQIDRFRRQVPNNTVGMYSVAGAGYLVYVLMYMYSKVALESERCQQV